jgi:hypothetical protein
MNFWRPKAAVGIGGPQDMPLGFCRVAMSCNYTPQQRRGFKRGLETVERDDGIDGVDKDLASSGSFGRSDHEVGLVFVGGVGAQGANHNAL